MSLIEGPPDTTIDIAGTHGKRRPTSFRWVICTLLFFATTVNYVDRAVLPSELESPIGVELRDASRVVE